MVSRYLSTSIILPAVLVLAACNDDGVPINLPGVTTGGGVITDASFMGIWDGTYIGNPPGNPEQWATTFTGLLYDGRMILYESNGQVWDSAYERTGAATMRAEDVLVFAPNGIQATRVLINGSLAGTDTLDLSYNLGTGVGLIQQQYGRNPAWERSSSLSLVSGIWSSGGEDSGAPEITLTINNVDGQAVLDGANSETNCLYNGVIELLDESRNLYEVSDFVVTDGVPGACDIITLVNIVDNEAPGGSRTEEVANVFAGGGYTGFATLLPNPDSLLIVVTNGSDRAVSFELAR
jgi:hypothetical protein